VSVVGPEVIVINNNKYYYNYNYDYNSNRLIIVCQLSHGLCMYVVVCNIHVIYIVI